MSVLVWVALIIGVPVVLFVVGGSYLAGLLKWEDDQTVGLGYYGRPLAEREAFKRQLRRHAGRLAPMLWLNAKLAKVDFRKARIQYRGVSGPTGSCSAETFAKAAEYQPRAGDVFVATQMKCGTTWMQHVVYEVLNRGNGNLVATGTALYAVAPWIEGRKSVPIEQAPTIGTERPSRIIKTHLPATLCPSGADARFIYVARHPVSCFASCIDFVVTNVGAMAPGIAAFEEWFCSPDLMWWGTWTDHVKGWWDRSRRDGNVLFVYFEDMKKDLPGVARRVAEFLGVKPLNPTELAHVVEKCGFRYMQEHQTSFEMHPPHILQTNAELFVAGTADRHKDVPDEVRQRILQWCARELADSDFPLSTVYPDVAAARP
ncbi:MAG: sulfotransferase domain-containing protein [Gemmatimonadales bacterium]|nr:sulfotransferase domain-containing protein [Gemmatimonadales bacterium]